MKAAITHVVLLGWAAGMLVAACGPATGGGRVRSAATGEWRAVSLDALAGRTWVLREWDHGEGVPAAPLVTLQYAEGRFTGRSGCNRYTGDVTAGTEAGAIAVGALAGTRMMCPEPVFAIESRFLAALPRANGLRMRAGRLGVVYTGATGAAMLIFDETRSAAN